MVGLLFGDDVLDGVFLDGAEVGGGDGACVGLFLRGGDGGGSDEGADVVGVEGEGRHCGSREGGRRCGGVNEEDEEDGRESIEQVER